QATTANSRDATASSGLKVFIRLSVSRVELLRGFLVRQDVARVNRRRWIKSGAILIDVLDDSILVDHERGAIAEHLGFVKDAIVLHDRSFEIAEQRERHGDVLCESFVGGNAVNADAE